MALNRNVSPLAQFLNVDLDIFSMRDLQPLVDILGARVLVLYAGRSRKGYCAHLEVAKTTRTPDSTIREFCRLIRALPAAERALWDGTNAKSFSIGIRAGKRPNPRDFAIRAKTVKAVSEVGGEIVITIYAPDEFSRPDIRVKRKASRA